MHILKQIKRDMEFNRELFQIFDVFKNIASTELRRLQSKRKRAKELFKDLEAIFESIDWAEYSGIPFLKEDKSKSSVYVTFTSDEGFSGGLNSMVLKDILALRVKEKDEIIVFGEKGARLMEGRGEKFIYFEGIGEDFNYTHAKNLTNYLIARFLKGNWGRVFFVYSHFLSISRQEIRTVELLPYKPQAKGMVKQGEREILIEPDIGRVVDYLIRIWMTSEVFEIFWESKLSEWASRIIHLEGSVQTLSEWYKKLRLQYIKSVHELRDISIRELFASRLE